MVRPRFNLGSTLKTLNLSLLRFNEWFGSENLDLDVLGQEQSRSEILKS